MRLRISTIGVVAPVVPVGVDATGAMVIPEQVSTLGWYQYSAQPGGTAGSMVIAGHVDSARQGLGVLFRLRDVPIGARIELTGTSGKIWDYRVIAREEFAKTTVPLRRPVLALRPTPALAHHVRWCLRRESPFLRGQHRRHGRSDLIASQGRRLPAKLLHS